MIHSSTLSVEIFSGSIHFFISVLDNGYSILITINGQVNANQNVTTIKRKGFFNKFHLILFCLSVFEMKKKMLQNMSSAIVI